MNYLGYLLILFGICTSLAEGTLIKKYNSKHATGGFLFTALVSLFSMFFFLIMDQNGFTVPKELWCYAMIAGLLYCTASFLTYVALECGSFAISLLILSYGLIFKIIYGLFFLKEEANIFTYLGLFAIMVSLFLTRAKKSSEDQKKVSFKWLVCITVSFFGSGMFGVISRMQQIRFDNSCTNEFMVLSLGFSTIVLLVAGCIIDQKQIGTILKKGGLYAVLAGISNGLTNYTTLIVNTLLPISLSSPISAGAKIVVTYIISKLLFHEQFLKRQVAGVILGAIALILLNL